MLRGDVFALSAPRRARGHEQRGRRYAVVLQADDLLELSTVIVAPTSTRSFGASFHPQIQIGEESTSVLVERLASVDLSRLGEQQPRVTTEEMVSLNDALRLVLGLA